MDILDKLQELRQEILDFGQVINYTQNPSDADLRNACELFSQHLNYQLETINSNIHFKNIQPEMQQTTAQLHQLSELITPDVDDNNETHQWTNRLHTFCDQIETLKVIAA